MATDTSALATVIATALVVGLLVQPHIVWAQSAQSVKTGNTPSSILSQLGSSEYQSLSDRELNRIRGTMLFKGGVDLHVMDRGGVGSQEHFFFERTLKPGEKFSFSRTLEGWNSRSSGNFSVSVSKDGSAITSSSSSSSYSTAGGR